MTFRGHEIWEKSERVLRLIREQGLDVKEIYASYGEMFDGNLYFIEKEDTFIDYFDNKHERGDIVVLNPKELIETSFTINRPILGLTIPNDSFWASPFSTSWETQNDPNTGANSSILIGFGSGFNNPIHVRSLNTRFVGGVSFGSSGGFKVHTDSNVFQWLTSTRIEFDSGTSGNVVGDCSSMTIIDNGSNKVDTNSVS